MRAFNIEQIYLNGKRFTSFKLYVVTDNNTNVFDTNQFIRGWYKREDTVLRKYREATDN